MENFDVELARNAIDIYPRNKDESIANFKILKMLIEKNQEVVDFLLKNLKSIFTRNFNIIFTRYFFENFDIDINKKVEGFSEVHFNYPIVFALVELIKSVTITESISESILNYYVFLVSIGADVNAVDDRGFDVFNFINFCFPKPSPKKETLTNFFKDIQGNEINNQ